MGAILDALHRLQEIELQIAEINRGIERKRRLVKKQEQTIADLDSRIRAEQTALRASQMESDRLELDMRSRDAEIAKLRAALNLAKTNKEYSAILTQLNTDKADNSKLEEKVLGILSQIDAKKADLAVLQETRDAEESKLGDLNASAGAATQQAEGRLTILRAERSEAAAAVPPKALESFNRVAGKNDGEAMAMVVRTNPRREEYACQGCNMSITLEQVNAIMSRDEAILCNNCGRILYFESAAASGAR